MRDWLVVQIISQEKRAMRKKHDTEKHSIESVRVFFFFFFLANFKYPALTQYHSDCKHRWTSSFLGRRAIIFSLAEFLKYLSNLPVFCFVLFCFVFFFSCIQRTQKSDYGRKRRGKIEREEKREEGKRVRCYFQYTGSILGTFLNEKKHCEKNWLFWPESSFH